VFLPFLFPLLLSSFQASTELTPFLIPSTQMFTIPNQASLPKVRSIAFATFPFPAPLPPSARPRSDLARPVRYTPTQAWTAFTPGGRMLPSSNRDRVVDVAEELVRVTCLLAPHKESARRRLWSSSSDLLLHFY
jgi:hypothetical protein